MVSISGAFRVGGTWLQYHSPLFISVLCTWTADCKFGERERAPGNIFWLSLSIWSFCMKSPIQHCQAFRSLLNIYLTIPTLGLIDRSRLRATTAAIAKSCNADTYTSANPKHVFVLSRQFFGYPVVPVASALCGLSSKRA